MLETENFVFLFFVGVGNHKVASNHTLVDMQYWESKALPQYRELRNLVGIKPFFAAQIQRKIGFPVLKNYLLIDVAFITANPTWGDIFECCFKAQSSKLEHLFSLKRGKRGVYGFEF